MAISRTLATAKRVLLQLRNDIRTVILMIAVPSVLMTLLRYAFDHQIQVFQSSGPMLLALFPFTVMFVIASIAMLRERSSGTLERLLSTPIAKAEILIGYAIAFGTAAILQVGIAIVVSTSILGLKISGSLAMLVLIALLDALLGMSLGLFLSAFANTEFQAVQFLPAFVLPQLLLGGLLIPRDQMASVLRLLSDVLPLSYALDAVARIASAQPWDHNLTIDLVVISLAIPLSLLLGAATLRRRTD